MLGQVRPGKVTPGQVRAGQVMSSHLLISPNIFNLFVVESVYPKVVVLFVLKLVRKQKEKCLYKRAIPLSAFQMYNVHVELVYASTR